MLGKLLASEMDELLHRQVIGRLGCHADGETYVVPINYFYKNMVIYAQSGVGKKIKMMRKNPKVCLEVDEITDTFSWKSVILNGNFEEILDGEEKQEALQGLIHTLMPLTNTPEENPSHAIAAVSENSDEKIETIVYKISINKRSGRFERNDSY